MVPAASSKHPLLTRFSASFLEQLGMLSTDPKPLRSSPCLSIITISKDDPAGLAKTLESSLNQSFQNYEHILVLTGSSRDIEIPNDTRLRIIYDMEGGISNAFNLGLTIAHGEWVQFLNGGDVYTTSESLSSIMSCADERFEMILSFAEVHDRKFTIPRQSLNSAKDEFLYASHQASIFRRSLFKKYGFYDLNLSIRMDLDWLCRIDPKTPYHFTAIKTIRFDPNGISSTSIIKSSLEEASIFWKNKRYRNRVPIVLTAKLPFRIIRRISRIIKSSLE